VSQPVPLSAVHMLLQVVAPQVKPAQSVIDGVQVPPMQV
jgi:hypothetical protein